MELAAIGLGANIGDRLNALRVAVAAIEPLLHSLRASRVYETEPRYNLDQPPFLNATIVGSTSLPPRRLLSELQSLEVALGRQRSGPRYGPRHIDLDLLFYGGRTIETPDLVIPHPRMRERAFVLVPLSDVAPDWRFPAGHPDAGRRIEDLVREADRSGVRETLFQLPGGES